MVPRTGEVLDRRFWLVVVAAVGAVIVVLAVILSSGPPYTIVLFRETGLPAGRPWVITVDNVNYTALGATIILRLTASTYAFRASLGNGTDYIAWPASGNVTVSASGASVSIEFVRSTANLSIREDGLPGRVSWTVAEGTTDHSSNTTFLNVTEPDGNHNLRVLVAFDQTIHNSGPTWIDEDLYLSNVSRLNVKVNGSDVGISVRFALLLHVNFTLFPVPVFPNDTALGSPAYEYVAFTFYRYSTANVSFRGPIVNNVTQNSTGYVMTRPEFDAFTGTGDPSRYLVTTGNVSEANLSTNFASGAMYFMVTGWAVDEFRSVGLSWSISFPGTVLYFS